MKGKMKKNIHGKLPGNYKQYGEKIQRDNFGSMKQYYENFMSNIPCPVCKGRD